MTMLTFYFFIATIVATSLSAPMTCPHLEDLFPCTCKRLAYGLHVVCANFNDTTSLVKGLKILRDYKIHTLLLHNLQISETLPSDLFDGIEVTEIRVEKSELKFSKPAFSGLDPFLHVLNVAQRSQIQSNEKFSLAKLSRLSELYVQSNQLASVEDQWLNSKIPNVHKINLDYNAISTLGSHAFANLKQLEAVSLADNRIEVIERSMFPRPALHLSKIDLSYNMIKTIPEDFFEEMPALREIVFSGNDIKTLSQKAWLPVWEHLNKVLLFDNPLECDDSIKWIKNYRLPQQLDGNCFLPKERKGISLKDLHST